MYFDTKIEPADVILVPGGSQPQLMERAAELSPENGSLYFAFWRPYIQSENN